jgi:hypothetical protein
MRNKIFVAGKIEQNAIFLFAKTIAQSELPFDQEEVAISAEQRAWLIYEKNQLCVEACAAFGNFARPQDSKESAKEEPFEVHILIGGLDLKKLSTRLNRVSHLLYQLNKEMECGFTPEIAQKNQAVSLLARNTAENIEQAIPQLFRLYDNEMKNDFLDGFAQNDTVYFNFLRHLNIVQNTKEIFNWLKHLLSISKP